MPPGYILVSNTSGSSPGSAHALAQNVSAAMVSIKTPSLPPLHHGESLFRPPEKILRGLLCRFRFQGA